MPKVNNHENASSPTLPYEPYKRADTPHPGPSHPHIPCDASIRVRAIPPQSADPRARSIPPGMDPTNRDKYLFDVYVETEILPARAGSDDPDLIHFLVIIRDLATNAIVSMTIQHGYRPPVSYTPTL